MPFAISKKYENIDWINLNLTDDASKDWSMGISIIEDRFKSRFFNHINLIKNDEFSGFLTMSIDCLLIETLMQFYLGIENTETNYRGEQWKSFKDFLIYSKHFNADFSTNKKCKIFYQHFRCGLLHQAQTKHKSRIKINQSNFVVLANSTNIDEGLIIDRKQFHDKLILEFEDYIQRLKDNKDNFQGQNLRIKAIDKMNLICV
ncbi:hypothetical protein FCR2A7T_24110 [Flavobacterium cauense R2A-7]|uniref:Uncharacterized protein n=1 Tax=Flavobacterium cauense R2A-7 TaxID=1341154 RepID=V6RXV6_9FLAO|nr:hypothetical protein [Flavobacterium cauense]ESU18999.1 hypothetical protein FCR2A7T_24110 [Flavobacterium cauense R2A-7]KGO82369.1 hypothetical protein Q762_06755 [Flavobacterium cauense R2A-7]TWI15338.1 hypothetical protein IP98_00330 [Flavobacterium cauense R2A-7]